MRILSYFWARLNHDCYDRCVSSRTFHSSIALPCSHVEILPDVPSCQHDYIPPMVGSWNSKNSSLTKRTTKHDLPTAVSPRRTSLKWWTRLAMLEVLLLFVVCEFVMISVFCFHRLRAAANCSLLFSARLDDWTTHDSSKKSEERASRRARGDIACWLRLTWRTSSQVKSKRSVSALNELKNDELAN